eukprot:scaffold39926_cov199-Amphora_coffeaeformis.AAC.2
MKIAVAATLLATASAFSVSPQQVWMTAEVVALSIDNRSIEGSKVPIGVTTNARRSERVKRVHHSSATGPDTHVNGAVSWNPIGIL